MDKKIRLYYKKSYIIKELIINVLISFALFFAIVDQNIGNGYSKLFLLKSEVGIFIFRIILFIALLSTIFMTLINIRKFLSKTPFLIISKDGINNFFGIKKSHFYKWEDILCIKFDNKSSFKSILLFIVITKNNREVGCVIPKSSYEFFTFKKDFLDNYGEIIDTYNIEIKDIS